MAANSRTQNALVAVLAALAVGASGYAVWSVGRPHPSLGDAEAATGAAQSRDDDAVSSSAPEGGTEDPSAITQAEPSVSQPSAPNIESWVTAWSGDADLLVVGDGFSNMPDQWVQLWAAHLGYGRPVQIHHWGEAADVAFNEPIVLADRGDSPLTVWSASRAGATIHAAAERYDGFVEASAKPDAVLVTLGRSSEGEDISAGLDALIGQIDDDVPVLLSIGPEGLYGQGVSDALRAWGEETAERVSVVDLREQVLSAPTAEEWARAFQAALES